MHIELVKGTNKWFWKIVGRNGETVLVSQRYKTKWSAKRTALKLALANNYEMRVGYPITRPRVNGIV